MGIELGQGISLYKRTREREARDTSWEGKGEGERDGWIGMEGAADVKRSFRRGYISRPARHSRGGESLSLARIPARRGDF